MLKIGFDNIFEHVISLDNFMLEWRFTEEKYERLPNSHLDLLKPLDLPASRFLWNYILESNLYGDFPFTKDLFPTIDAAKIQYDNKNEIKKWLYQRGIPFDKPVYLSWDKNNAMIVPWKLLIKYYDCFYYPSSDDLTVIDQSLNWILLFYHEDEIYFGSNKNYSPSDTFTDLDFIWK